MKRKTPSLAYSEYVALDPENSAQTWRARLAFIDTARRVFPRFLNKLSTDVFPVYCKLANEGYDFFSILWVRKDLSSFDLLSSGNLKTGLTKWADEFNVGAATWVLDGSLRTLYFWHVAPEERKALAWHKMQAFSVTTSTGERFKFDCEGWETDLLTWPRYSQSVRERFEAELLGYEKETRNLAESSGLVRARQKYSPDNFEWFVLYQIAGWSSTEIAHRWAEKKAIDESTVLKGIKAAAKLLGWENLRNTRQTVRIPNRKIR